MNHKKLNFYRQYFGNSGPEFVNYNYPCYLMLNVTTAIRCGHTISTQIICVYSVSLSLFVLFKICNLHLLPN